MWLRALHYSISLHVIQLPFYLSNLRTKMNYNGYKHPEDNKL